MNSHPTASPMAGFDNPVLDSQQTFRVILEAMSRPGRIIELPVLPRAPVPLTPTAVALCLTLLDLDTPLWLDEPARLPEVVAHLSFHCGCPITDEKDKAAFALISDGRRVPPLETFNLGDPLTPESSTTLIIQVESLNQDQANPLDQLESRTRIGFLQGAGGLRLRGPGIETEVFVHATGLCESLPSALRANRALFPRGVDVLLLSPHSVCGLPRTVIMEG